MDLRWAHSTDFCLYFSKKIKVLKVSRFLLLKCYKHLFLRFQHVLIDDFWNCKCIRDFSKIVTKNHKFWFLSYKCDEVFSNSSICVRSGDGFRKGRWPLSNFSAKCFQKRKKIKGNCGFVFGSFCKNSSANSDTSHCVFLRTWFFVKCGGGCPKRSVPLPKSRNSAITGVDLSRFFTLCLLVATSTRLVQKWLVVFLVFCSLIV